MPHFVKLLEPDYPGGVRFDLVPHVRMPHFAKLLKPVIPWWSINLHPFPLGALSEESQEGVRTNISREDAPFRQLRGEWVK